MNLTFDEYENIIEESISERIKKLKLNNINDKNQILELSKEITYVFSSLVIPALSPFNLNVNLSKSNDSIIFNFSQEKMYKGNVGQIGTLKVDFKKNNKNLNYKYKSINLSLNSHYFLIYGNIDKIK